jgi:hypothetical protein
MRRYRGLAALFLGLFLAASLGGLIVARRLGPQRLQFELEQRLSAALATPVQVSGLSVSPGTFVRVNAYGVRAWPGLNAPGLDIRRLSGSIDAMSLLVGEVRLRRMLIDGAHLRVSQIQENRSREVDRPQEPPVPHPDELLSPLIALEIAVRSLLEAPRLATVVETQEGRIELGPVGPPGSPASLELREIKGRLVHHRFRGSRELVLRARLVQAERGRGMIELRGQRDRHGSIQIALSLNSLELGAGAHYLSELRPEAQLTGSVSGEIVYETTEPGTGRLEIDLHCQNLRSAVQAGESGVARLIDLPGVDIAAALEITPQRATVRQARIATQQTTLLMNGTVTRPLQSGSLVELALEFDDVQVPQVRHLIGWLPEIEREEAEAIVAPLEAGRLVALRAGGAATLSGWQDFLAGRSRRLPRGFRVEAELADTSMLVGESDRLEDLSGRLRWTGQRVEISGASAALNGAPLPVLDLVIDGFPNFFAGDAAARRLHSGAEPLTGLAALWESLRPRPDSVAADVGTTLALDIDHLDHPMFLWPIRELQVAIESRAEGVHIEAASGSWAGVPIQARADWKFVPHERVTVALRAQTPTRDLASEAPEEVWASGRFGVGAISGGRWRQRQAHGRFAASGGEVRIRDLAIELEPSGQVDAHGLLDLSETDSVPFRASFVLEGGDAVALAKLVGLPPKQALGRVNLAGSFEGIVRPGASLFPELTGLLEVVATDGVIRKVAPPVVAIAEASEALEDFDRRDVLRFQQIETVLEFANGGMHTETFSLDGPEIGVVASGDIDLVGQDKEIDGRVALFLFRKLDQVLAKIPILNRLLLGTDANLVAAYFQVSGPWKEPEVKSILLPRSAGPASVVLQGVPMFVMRGIHALGSIIRPEAQRPSVPPANEPPSGNSEGS